MYIHAHICIQVFAGRLCKPNPSKKFHIPQKKKKNLYSSYTHTYVPKGVCRATLQTKPVENFLYPSEKKEKNLYSSYTHTCEHRCLQGDFANQTRRKFSISHRNPIFVLDACVTRYDCTAHCNMYTAAATHCSCNTLQHTHCNKTLPRVPA